jgi:hypothetical protein
MHKHKRFRHGPPLFRPFKGGWIWLIILALLFSGGGKDWWPIIFIAIGLYFLFGSVFREERPSQPPPPAFDDAPPPARAEPAPPSPAFVQRPGILPSTCPQCGGPVRPGEVKWTSDHSTVCSYCGSNLETGKQ